MKKFFQKVLDKLIDTLQQLRESFSTTGDHDLPFSSLAPLPIGDSQGYYCKALKWALENRTEKEIRNIALTGPYGSGKSTVLKTFQKAEKANYKFLNISLATFREEKPSKDEEGNLIKQDKKTLLRLIETSILEQIFYNERPENIPDSRFKRITRIPVWKKLIYSAGITIVILATVSMFQLEIFRKLFIYISASNEQQIWLHWILIFIVSGGVFAMAYKSIRIVNSLAINKLTIQNAEIGFSGLSKSVMNRHIDELVYFFSERPYDVVVFEDLDRFEQTEIFTKLRELNLILNSSSGDLRGPIVFVYAIRDEIFVDKKERTKFFDFIIPIIPVINSSNSAEMLYKKRNDYGWGVSDGLIESISFYLDDMRLLHNVCNEFYIYRNLLDEKLLPDKMFAIISYKNLYPDDFVKLINNEGELYQLFQSVRKWVKEDLDDISNEINKRKKEIAEIEALKLNDLKELRKLYILEYLSDTKDFRSFYLKGKEVSIKEAQDDDYFHRLEQDQFSYFNSRLSRNNFNLTFSQVESLVDSRRTYKEREKEVLRYTSGRVDLLKDEIREFEKQMNRTRRYKTRDFIIKGYFTDTALLNPQLIKVLLRNEAISEDYANYISLFHSVSITKKDYQFLLSIRNEESLDFEYTLNNINKLILKLQIEDFRTRYVLNYDLLNYLLTDVEKFSEQLQAILGSIIDATLNSMEFLKGFVKVTPNLEVFFFLLSEAWPNIWKFLQNNKGVTELDKSEFYKYIIWYSKISALQKIVNQSDLAEVISSDTNFLSLIDDSERIKEVISSLRIKFVNLNFDDSPKELLWYVYEHRSYALNESSLKGMMKSFGKFEVTQFEQANLSSLKNSGCEELIDYVFDEMNQYIEQVYLKLENNTEEPEPEIIEILNHQSIELDKKRNIIKLTSTKITEIQNVELIGLYDYILSNKKMEPTWENVLYYYLKQEHKFDDHLIVFLSDLENAKKLSSAKIPSKYDSEKTVDNFSRALINAIDIELDIYGQLMKSVPWVYPSLNVNDLPRENIEHLIDLYILKGTIENFSLLQENEAADLSIRLIERNADEFIKLSDEIKLDGNDLTRLLQSDRLEDLQKFEFVKVLPISTISSNQFNTTKITEIVLRNPSVELDVEVLDYILMAKEVPVGHRVKMYVLKKSTQSNKSFFQSFLNQLGGKYIEILHPSKRSKFPNNGDHVQLLNIAKQEGFISSYKVEKEKYLRIYKPW